MADTNIDKDDATMYIDGSVYCGGRIGLDFSGKIKVKIIDVQIGTCRPTIQRRVDISKKTDYIVK